MNLGDNTNTFIFGVVTGIAVVAVVQYVVGIFQDSRLTEKRSVAKNDKGNDQITERSVKVNMPLSMLASEGQALVKTPVLQPFNPQFPNNESHVGPGITSIMNQLDAKFVVSSSKLQKIVLHMVQEFKKGLSSDNETFKMIPSYVVKRPNGNEKGTFLALDLGGTNFRVCMVTLEGHGSIRMTHEKFTVSDELKKGSGEQLFDFFAECVQNFCVAKGLDQTKVGKINKVVPMGYTFSFPLNQTAINKGTLVRWTKGFACEGVEGKDVVDLLQVAFHRRGLNIEIRAVINDTVGTLVAHAYSDPQTFISVILGTGTNAAYVERSSNIEKWPHDDGEVIINTEWGAYHEESVLPITEYDNLLDRQSANPKKQIFEKMISGMYLGEITRLVLVDLIKTGELFNGNGGPELFRREAFDTAHMSRIERDHSLGLSDVKQVFEDIFRVPSTSLEDRRIIKHICELVGTRAARLSAAGIAALVTKINRLNQCTVAIDGSVYEHYPHFGNRMRDALRELLGITADNIVLEQARDGSGQGAALTAALAQ